MPKPPLPPELDRFLAQPNPAVIATLRPDGSPHTAATWYLWEGGRVLVNMDESRKRLDYLRSDPRASITVMGQENWYYHVSLRDARSRSTRTRGSWTSTVSPTSTSGGRTQIASGHASAPGSRSRSGTRGCSAGPGPATIEPGPSAPIDNAGPARRCASRATTG